MNADLKAELKGLCENDLLSVIAFLEPYLPLANLHNTNFIVSQYWNQVKKIIRFYSKYIQTIKCDQLKESPSNMMLSKPASFSELW